MDAVNVLTIPEGRETHTIPVASQEDAARRTQARRLAPPREQYRSRTKAGAPYRGEIQRPRLDRRRNTPGKKKNVKRRSTDGHTTGTRLTKKMEKGREHVNTLVGPIKTIT